MRRSDDLRVVIEPNGACFTSQDQQAVARDGQQKDHCGPQHHPAQMKPSFKLILYVGGILVSYSLYGIYQEKIFKGKFGPEKQVFSCQFSVLLIQCFLNGLLARVLLSTVWKQGHDRTSYTYYIATSFFYLIAMLTSTIALKFVNYPTQVIAKSCKPIPVMILGVLLARKRYSLLKYCFIMLIVIGVATFMYEDKKVTGKQSASASASSSSSSAGESPTFAYVLLLVSLLCDGLIGAFQDRMRQNFQTKSLHLMSQLNFLSVVYLVLALLYVEELPVFFRFVQQYPQLYVDVTLLSICSAVGQIFIYSTVAEFGPLICSVATTTRKFFTVLGSVLLFGNALSETKWIGTALVFSGLFLDAFYGKSAIAAKKA